MVADIAFSWLDFLTVILLAFVIVLALAGTFTAYFGNGKSRIFGLIMIIASISIGTIWIYLCISGVVPNVDVWHVFKNASVNTIAVILGTAAAVTIFLVSLLKS